MTGSEHCTQGEYHPACPGQEKEVDLEFAHHNLFEVKYPELYSVSPGFSAGGHVSQANMKNYVVELPKVYMGFREYI